VMVGGRGGGQDIFRNKGDSRGRRELLELMTRDDSCSSLCWYIGGITYRILPASRTDRAKPLHLPAAVVVIPPPTPTQLLCAVYNTALCGLGYPSAFLPV